MSKSMVGKPVMVYAVRNSSGSIVLHLDVIKGDKWAIPVVPIESNYSFTLENVRDWNVKDWEDNYKVFDRTLRNHVFGVNAKRFMTEFEKVEIIDAAYVHLIKKGKEITLKIIPRESKK